ncbi:uncharacterized protein LOC111138434 [Crassostrea virginica]
METISIALIIFQLMQVFTMDQHRCQKDGTVECCSGYYEMENRCIECFGWVGFNCSTPCPTGTYGYLCKDLCHCKDNEVCNRFQGCISIDDDNNSLMAMIAFGIAVISSSFVFASVMFYRWRTSLQRNLQSMEKSEGFQVNVISLPEKQETLTYDEVRESRMLEKCVVNCSRETGEYRINSTDYNQLFGLDSVRKKTIIGPFQQYNTIDARFGKKTLGTMPENFEDDCYVSLSKNEKLSNRHSKSYADLKVKFSSKL